MKKQLLFVCGLLFSFVAVAQVNSVNGNFTATTPSNLSLQTGATPTTRLSILQSNGYVGIGTGTAVPADLLHVNGNIRANQINSITGILNTTASTTNLSFRTNNVVRMTLLGSNGNVGIGTTTPGSFFPSKTLEIADDRPVLKLSSTVVGGLSTVVFTNTSVDPSSHLGEFHLNYQFNSANADKSLMMFGVVPNRNVLALEADGNVGIGTTTPGFNLDVNGTINSAGKGYFGGYSQGQSLAGAGSANSYSYEVGGPNPDGISGDATIFFHHHYVLGHQLRYNNGNLFLEAAGNGYGTNPTPNFLVGGNVGIGTTTPAYKLDVNGTINATNILVGGQPILSGSSVWTNVGADINFTTGKVGIGTTTPGSVLNVADNGVSIDASDIFNGGLVIQGNTGGRSQTTGAQLEFAIPANTDGSNVWGQGRIITVAANQNNQDASGKMILGTRRMYQKPGTSQIAWYYGEDLTIDPSGSIGIGTTTPAYKLDVKGTINATGILVNGLPISTGGVTTISGGTTGLMPAAATAGVITLAGTLKTSNGGTGVTAVTTTPAASAFAGWDANKNMKANNFTPSYTAVTTANTTTTLAVTSTYYQNFTGTATQIVKLPIVTTLSNGHQFYFKNSSTQPITVQTSDGTVIQALATNSTLALTCINIAGGTGTASWQWVYNPNTVGSPVSQWSTTGSNIAFTTGNVGIGKTPAAGYKLDVNGTINATGVLVNGLPISSGISSQWTTTGSDITFGTGNVAIGSGSSPLNGLNVFKSGDFNGGSIRYGFSGTNDGVLSLGFNSLTGRDAMKLSFFPHNSKTGQSDLMTLDINGNVGIGTANPTQKLTVKGTVYSTEVKVDLSAGAPDYVFEKDYNLPTLDSIKNYIDKNKHLPEIPSAKEFEKNGVNLGEMNMLLLKKIEELTLLMIQQEKRIKELENKK